jgi:hypothetical protein
LDIILGRPTANSVTLSILAYRDIEGYIEYGTKSNVYKDKTRLTRFIKDEPLAVVVGALRRDRRYFYRLCHREAGETVFKKGEEFVFHTQRAPGSEFTFTIQSDPHLDQFTNPELYARTVLNALAEKPDFHLDLGDTFMGNRQTGEPRNPYLVERYYFGLLCHSAPFFFALGNHDSESGSRGDIATNLRKKYYPNPFPDGFYTGNTDREEGVGVPQNYYAWEWGNALFVVLDLFRYSEAKKKGVRSGGSWGRTLGQTQYQWLKKTLENSKSRFKFVFTHHLMGGLDGSGRGGIEVAKYFEWGGHDKDGRYIFEEKRPGWSEPIHQLLVRNKVDIVFHGHDHFFAKQDLDGVVYQLVPQPGYYKTDGYGHNNLYVNGKILPCSGHIRVKVSKGRLAVDYVRAYTAEEEEAGRKNGEIAYSYTIKHG